MDTVAESGLNIDYSIALSKLKASDPILATWIDRVGTCKVWQVQQTGDLLFSLSRSILY